MNATGGDARPDVPGWSACLGAHGYATFIALVRKYFSDRALEADVDEHMGVVRSFEGSARGTFGLQNLGQHCRSLDKDEWFDAISRHFEAIVEAHAELGNVGQAPLELASARSSLRARLLPSSMASGTRELVCRRGPAGTIEVLTLDQPRAARTMTVQECREWGMSDAELLEIGRRNLVAGGLLQMDSVHVERGGQLYVLSGDAFYAASHALVLDEYLPDDLRHGALVGIPRRDVLLVHLIRNVGTLEIIASMLQLVTALYAEGPGSITANLLWYIDGTFRNLEYSVEDSAINFIPPAEFVDMLQALSSGAKLS